MPIKNRSKEVESETDEKLPDQGVTDSEPREETELEKAARHVLDLYRKSHTVESNKDFHYPGLRKLADALDKLN